MRLRRRSFFREPVRAAVVHSCCPEGLLGGWIMVRCRNVLALVALILLLPGCGKSKVSKANFDKIQVGMSEKEVVALLGKGLDVTNPSKAPSGGFGGAAGGIVAPDISSSGPSGPTRLPALS